MLKEYVTKALYSIIKRTNDRSQASLWALMKEIRNRETISSLNELQTIKFMGPKTFMKIKAELEKQTEISGLLTEPGTQQSKVILEVEEIKQDMEKMSSNLSEMELKYLSSKNDTSGYTGEISSIVKRYRNSIQANKEYMELLEENETTKNNITELKQEKLSSTESADDLTAFNDIDLSNIDLDAVINDKREIKEPNQKIVVEKQSILMNRTSDDTSDIIIISTTEDAGEVVDLSKTVKIAEEPNKINIKSTATIITNSCDKKKETIRKYKPRYKSYSYAIIKALYLSRNGLHKNVLFLHAKEHMPSDRTKNTNSYNITELKKKGIIYEENKKYYLTESGCTLAESMQFNKDEAITNNTSRIDQIRLTIDRRERRSQREFVYFQKELHDLGVETRTLELGDFIWMRGLTVLPYIIERKQTSDFLQSVFTGRFKEQCHRLRNLDNFKVFYIIEEDKKVEGRSLNQEITNLTINNNFTVVRTRNISETVSFIRQFDQYIKDEFESIDECGIGFGSFTEKTSKNAPMNPSEVLYNTLIRIKGVTPVKAEAISLKYETTENLLKNITTQNTTNLSQVTFKNKENETVVIGIKLAQKIVNLIL
ncbi:MUS81 [Enterospora canceri]|uniref:Crossover junction endonuclease MUS81 n=1 Tax=Enterospora canceri TaxID=1081671 RepID=A0A1Y1S4W6_9MICR|nr:MUS81 [Enterospora canceri]